MFFVLPLKFKQRNGKDSIPAANALLIAVNIILFGLGGFWTIGPGSGLLNILLYGFSHWGLIHLLGNMWALWVFGNPVNRRLGNGYYLLAYLGTILVLGLIARIFLHICLAGSSGGLFAVIAIALILMPNAKLEVGYLLLFPLTLLVGLLKLPAHWLYWFVRWGLFSIPAVWCLALIPLIQLWSFFWSGWNLVFLAHLLGMACGIAVVLLLPARISMPGRSPALN
jgi:membrane associated rhomboid family serine protease